MTLEEINQMDEIEVFQRLADFMGWKRKHFSPSEIREAFSYHSNDSVWYFKHDGEWRAYDYLTEDLETLAEIEACVIQQAGFAAYGKSLFSVFMSEATPESVLINTADINVAYGILATADATQRSRACLLALTES